jgi:hypothetical protein
LDPVVGKVAEWVLNHLPIALPQRSNGSCILGGGGVGDTHKPNIIRQQLATQQIKQPFLKKKAN